MLKLLYTIDAIDVPPLEVVSCSVAEVLVEL